MRRNRRISTGIFIVLFFTTMFAGTNSIGMVENNLDSSSERTNEISSLSTDSMSQLDYEEAVENLFSIFNEFNLSKYGGGWQVEVWEDFSDYAWSQGKKAYFDAQCIVGLVEAWNFTNNDSYLQYAEDIWNWDRAHFWDSIYGGYYERLDGSNAVQVGNKRLWFQCLTGIALIRLYEATSNSSYKLYFDEMFNFITDAFYDPAYGSYYSTISSTLSVIEETNDINDIGWCTRFLLEAYSVTQNDTYKERAVDLIDHFLLDMFDYSYGWYYNRVTHDWSSVIKDSKGWYDNFRLLIDAYRILGNATYLDYAQNAFDDIQQANSTVGYLMEMNREWTSYVNNEVNGEEDPNVAISYLYLGTILGNDTILKEAFRFKNLIYSGLNDSVHGGMHFILWSDASVSSWKQWLSQGLIMEMLSVFGNLSDTDDISVPQITGTTHDPTVPYDTDNVTVFTNVTDTSGIDFVNLSLRVNNGAWTVSEMIFLVDGLYLLSLGFFAPGTIVEYFIIACDSSYNHNIVFDTNRTANYIFTVGSNDWTGPGIFNVVQSHDNPTNSDIIIINATITDLSGISSASVYYRIDGGAWSGVLMENIDNGLYQASIGPITNGGTIQYFLSAADGSLNHNIAINDNRSSYFQFTVYFPDVNGPTIELFPRIPQNPTILDSVTIRANITDEHEIGSVILSYTTSESSSWTNVTMNFEDGFYKGVIPSVSENVVITYKIIAYDAIGNYEISDTQTYTVTYAMETMDPIDILFGAITISSLIVSIIGLFFITGEIRKRRITS